MSIKKEDVNYVAHLSRLKIPDDQIERITSQLACIISYISKLNELDTRDVPPTSHPLPMKNVFRKDKVKRSLDTEKALSVAVQKKDKFFKVPRVIEES